MGKTITHDWATTEPNDPDDDVSADNLNDHREVYTGLTAGHVLRASGAAAADFAAIQDGDLPSTIARDSEVTAAVSAHAGAADPHTGYQRESEKAQANGYASLDGSTLVPDNQIPPGIARDSEVTSAIGAEATARDAAIAAAIAALINSAPGVLNTLDEIAAAIGDDPNFATTLATALAGKQALDAELTALAGLVSAADRLPYFTGLGSASVATFTTFARTLVDDADASTMRATLGLGTIATQAASAVNITGGTIGGITDLAVADGGTGASDASGARTNLGLVLGTNVPSQAAFDDHSARHENGGADEISIAGLDGTPVELTNHLNDTVDAHDASAISFSPTGTISSTDVQAAIAEVAAEAGGGGGSTSFKGCKITRAAAQSIANNTLTNVDFDTEDIDTDTMHFTSAANLTGTLSKTSGSAAVVGVGTAFTTELAVGQVISVPGTAAERRVVTAIADDTHLTVNANFANTASGQTAARVRDAIVFRTAGYWRVGARTGHGGTGSGDRVGQILIQSGTSAAAVVGGSSMPPVVTNPAVGSIDEIVLVAQWDIMTFQLYQTSGNPLNTTTSAGYVPRLSCQFLGT